MYFFHDKMRGHHLLVVSLLKCFVIFRLTSASGHSGEEMSDSSRILAVTTGGSGDHGQKHLQLLAAAAAAHQQQQQQQQQQPASAASSLYGISRPGRHLGIGSSLSPTNLLGLASANNYGYAAVPEYGEHGAASGSYGHNHGGGGGGYGGWGFAKADCNSALGLLGVLGLVSFLQNVLRQMSTTTANPNNGRRRRRSEDHETTDKVDAVLSSTNDIDHGHDYTSELHRVTNLMLPLLTAVAHARDRFVPHYCTHREVCNANTILANEFGLQGRSLGTTMTEAVAKMLTKDTKSDYKISESNIIRGAGKSGRNGDNCEVLFKPCPELQWLPTYSIPPSMLVNQERLSKSLHLL